MPLDDLLRTPARHANSKAFRTDRDWSHRSNQISSSPEAMHPVSQGDRRTPRAWFSHTLGAVSPLDSLHTPPKIRLPSLTSFTDSFAKYGDSGFLTLNPPKHACEAGTRQNSYAYEEVAHHINSQVADRRPSFGRPYSHSAPMPYPKVESLFSSSRHANPGRDDALSQSTSSSRSRSFSASDAADSVLEGRAHSSQSSRSSTQGKTLDASNPKMYACTGCDRTFARRYDRNRHARKHTGEKVGRTIAACGPWLQKLTSSLRSAALFLR